MPVNLFRAYSFFGLFSIVLFIGSFPDYINLVYVIAWAIVTIIMTFLICDCINALPFIKEKSSKRTLIAIIIFIIIFVLFIPAFTAHVYLNVEAVTTFIKKRGETKLNWVGYGMNYLVIGENTANIQTVNLFQNYLKS
jgi:hypothetical protein